MTEPKTCGECWETDTVPPIVRLCPRHASAEALYEAAKAASDLVANCAVEIVVAGYGAESAALQKQLTAAIQAYEGK